MLYLRAEIAHGRGLTFLPHQVVINHRLCMSRLEGNQLSPHTQGLELQCKQSYSRDEHTPFALQSSMTLAHLQACYPPKADEHTESHENAKRYSRLKFLHSLWP